MGRKITSNMQLTRGEKFKQARGRAGGGQYLVPLLVLLLGELGDRQAQSTEPFRGKLAQMLVGRLHIELPRTKPLINHLTHENKMFERHEDRRR